MSGVALHINLRDLERLQDRFERLGRLDGRELRLLLDELGELGVSQTRQRFRDQTGPDGTAWKPSRRLIEDGGQILVDQSILRNSIGYQAGGGRVEIGTNLIYGAIHQFGGEEVGMPIDARPYLGLSASDEAEVEDTVDDFIREALR